MALANMAQKGARKYPMAISAVLHDISKKDNRVSAVENTLDLSVMVTVGKAKFLLMLQGQTIEHYVMPVRASHERGTDYYNQWKKLQKMHNEARDLMKGEEYLSAGECDWI